jgi:hypothetical protein
MTQPDFTARNQVDVLVRERAEALTKRWLAATGAIGAVALLLSMLANTMPEKVSGFLVLSCWLVGGVLAVLSVVLPRGELADSHIAKWVRAPVDAYRWAKRMGLNDDQQDVFIDLPPAEQSLVGLTILYERPLWLGLGLSLGVALVGFVYGLLFRAVLEAAPFLIAALALNCWHYPRLTKLIDRGRTMQSAAEDEAQARALADLQRSQPPKPQRNTTPRLRRSRTSDRP